MKNIFFVLCLLWAVSAYGFELKNGDLLFRVGRGSGFEQAVEASTSGRDKMPFTHVGVAVREGEIYGFGRLTRTAACAGYSWVHFY